MWVEGTVLTVAAIIIIETTTPVPPPVPGHLTMCTLETYGRAL